VIIHNDFERNEKEIIVAYLKSHFGMPLEGQVNTHEKTFQGTATTTAKFIIRKIKYYL
jgi:hypothetical protein